MVRHLDRLPGPSAIVTHLIPAALDVLLARLNMHETQYVQLWSATGALAGAIL